MFKRVAVAAAGAAAVATVWAGTAVGASGAQRFSISATDNTGTVYASGPVSGTGTDKAIDQNTDKFTFAGGKVWVSHHATSQTGGNIDPRTCAGRFSEKGTYTLVSGTGMYRGVSGSGTYSASGTIRQTRTAAGCTGTPTSRYFVSASGTTNLP
jgi:hypothetical protein